MKVLIVEDEPLTAQRLADLLKEYDPAIEIMAVTASVAESVQWLQEQPAPDLIFMDIHLEDGESFSIFETLNLDVPVIFTTAYDEYMVRAFKVNSVDYLMKPVNFEELSDAIDKFRRVHSRPPADMPDGLHTLLQQLQKNESGFRERFLISVGSRLRSVSISEVQYFYSAGKITFVVTKDNQKFPLEYSLDKLASQLNPKTFFRANRQMILGLSAIDHIHVYPKSRLRVDLSPAFKEEVFVSLDRVTEFKEWLGR